MPSIMREKNTRAIRYTCHMVSPLRIAPILMCSYLVTKRRLTKVSANMKSPKCIKAQI